MSSKILEEYFLCPICIEIMKNPITTVCGHNFCRDCIDQRLKYCPICKKDVDFSEKIINYTLKNVIESIKNLNYEELKTKFFPEIKSEENQLNKEFSILSMKIFGIELDCKESLCRQNIRRIIFEIILNNKKFLDQICKEKDNYHNSSQGKFTIIKYSYARKRI